jgi:tRNA(fMet)-specific endonuclease VapC
MFLLDTNIVSYALKGVGRVNDRIRATHAGEIGVSSITEAELRYGVHKAGSRKLELAVDIILDSFSVLPFGREAARAYGGIRADLERRGTPIGIGDTLIAAHALSAKCTLVTNNRKHFERIAGLKIEDWT